MICPQCEGTMRECGCGTGKCDHCINGMIADLPCNQPYYVPHYLNEQDVSALVKYWNDPTCPDTIGEFLQRVGAAAVLGYKEKLLAAVRADRERVKNSLTQERARSHGQILYEGIPEELQCLERNRKRRERLERREAELEAERKDSQ